MRALSCAFLCACSFGGGPAPANDASPADVAATDVADAPVPMFTPWQTPRALIGIEVAGATFYDDPVLLSSGRLYYCVTNANGTEDIWVGNLDVASATVLLPSPITELNTTSRQTVPWVNESEERMFLSQDTTGDDSLDIVFSRRDSTAAAWGPTGDLLFTAINIPGSDEAVNNVSPDEREIILVSNAAGSFDLLRAARQEDNVPFDAAVALPFHSHPELDELGGRISADGLTMTYQARPQSDKSPPMDFYVSRRSSVDDEFPVGQPIVELNTDLDETDLWITRDGLVAVFASDRDGGPVTLFVTKREAAAGR